MAFPMTHTVKGFPCIAKYPVDEWEAAGAPTMTTKGWAKLRPKLTDKDPNHSQRIFDVATELGGLEEKSVSFEEIEV
eukprot:6653074-Lingulodinium_polyedra.AAC.1